MKRLFLLLIALFVSVSLSMGQKGYFQQWVNYTIHAKIDPSAKTLSATEKMVYYNNSPDTLRFLYIHLWPNAYQKGTALYRQLASQGKQKLVFGPKEYRGYIDSLDFRSDGKQLKWTQYHHNKDIAILYLNRPLAPGDSVSIETPFFVKIPKITSRMGYDDKVISVTQWYPKPAVYDSRGWHPLPYLDQGEFFSEFGRYDVTITLPSQYAIAATGNMLDSTEYKWRLKLANHKAVDVPYPTGQAWKTVRFVQDSVHDFAFFLSNQYYARRSHIRLPHSGRSVETWAFFTDTASAWTKGVYYIDSAIYYYSLWVGDYPYKVCTAVEGPLVAGGGMEYPTITVVSVTSGLEPVIVHEVGHNWFYGVLAFNERRYPFMDEGINSFYDHRYSRMKGLSGALPSSLLGMKMPSLPELLSFGAYNGMNQPLDLHSLDYTPTTYGLVVYEKTAFSLRYLQQYLGTQEFDRIMQKFFQQWKFRHPYPPDLKACFDKNATKPVDWFFDDIVGTNKTIDYGVKASSHGVELKNTGMVKAPMVVVAGRDTAWYLLAPGSKKNIAPKGTLTRIDPENITLDANHFNNFTRGLWPNKKLRISLLPKLFKYDYNYLTVAPVLFFRHLDGWVPGAIVSNFTVPFHKISFVLGGFYGLRSHAPSMMGYISYSRPPINGVPLIGISIYGDNFADVNDYSFGRLRKFAAYLKLGLWNKDNSDHWRKELRAGYVRLQELATSYRNEYVLTFTAKKQGQFHPARLKMSLRHINNLPMPWVTNGNLNMLTAAFDYMPLHYVSLSTGLRVRVFAGLNAPVMAMNMQTDFDHSNRFLTYYDTSSIWSNQVAIEYGSFMMVTPHVLYPWSVGMNISSTLPLKFLPFIRGFFDFAFVPQDKWLYETGLALSLGSIKFYVPLYANSTMMIANPGFKPFHVIRFALSMDMSKLIKIR